MKKVYIVDDDRNIVESITIVLESEGFEVGSQFDELNVVENVKAFDPDLVILDVMFPEDDSAGFKMARILKDDLSTQSIPVLMLSAINEKGIYAGTFSNKDIDDTYLPINDFAEKPINPEKLLQKVKELTN
jgi:CheY-like chemotaxis protein